MVKILVISDTHGYIGPEIRKHAKEVDEVWHAGDVGTVNVINELRKYTKVRFVFGNIDGEDVRIESEKYDFFTIDTVSVLITHIAGYPGKYQKDVAELITQNKPSIVVAGHSHILKVIYDKKLGHLHLNPGAIGVHGFHAVRTMLRFDINNGKPQNMRVLEYERK